jgi:hypothetical protein
MNRPRHLCFESLEDRKLLSTAHAAAHTRRTVVTTPLVLSGTLNVNNKATMSSMDEQGDTTTTTPVAGQLVGLGEVRGTWTTGSDEYGDYMGPDTLELHDSKGTFLVAFSEQNTSSVERLPGGAQESIHPEITSGGTRAYVHAKGGGSIAMTTNAARKVVETMTFS